MVELIIPSDREMMLVVRLAAAGVLSKYRLDIDALEDAKMAVEEACLTLIRYAGRERIRVVFTRNEGCVEFAFFAEGNVHSASSIPDEKELDVVKAILSSMVDEAHMDFCVSGIHTIRMLKRLPD